MSTEFTYQLFDGRRWRGPFRPEELPAQGVCRQTLLRQSKTRLGQLAGTFPDVDACLPANGAEDASASATLGYQRVPSVKPAAGFGRAGSDACAYIGIVVGVTAWVAAILLWSDHRPDFIRNAFGGRDIELKLLIVTMTLVPSAVLLGSVAFLEPRSRPLARTGRLLAWAILPASVVVLWVQHAYSVAVCDVIGLMLFVPFVLMVLWAAQSVIDIFVWNVADSFRKR